MAFIGNTHAKGAARPTLDEAKAMLVERGWTPSAASWEDAHRVFAFSRESYPGTYGDAAAAVTWASNEGIEAEAWLVTPPRKPKNARFV